jgi:hypothetical protein
VAVFRIDGTASLDDVSIDEIVRLARAWRERGVRVRGVEIDHDCPTAALAGYAAWLAGARSALAGLALSITALPTWVTSPVLPGLVGAVDDVVVQLHTIAAPVLFDTGQARNHAEAWARASKRSFRVALPTYQARLIDGTLLAAEPLPLAGFLADLKARPIAGLSGIVWFRLGNSADPNAWSPTTLAAVVGGAPLGAQIGARLVETNQGALDIVLQNRGNLDGEGPEVLALSGAIEILDGVRGFTAHGSALRARARPRLRAGESAVVGYVRGRGIDVAIP